MVSSVYRWLKGASLLACLLAMLSFAPSHPVYTNPPFVLPHPFFVSVTEIEYNEAEKTIEISCKVFTDDFEKALVKANNTVVDIYKPKDKALLEKQISDYIRKHLQLKVDGKPLNLQYVGYEIEDQSTLSYYQANQVASVPKKIEIDNSIFFESIEKQISIIHVIIKGQRKSTKLDYPDTHTVFEF
jgi:hypothetical protein